MKLHHLVKKKCNRSTGVVVEDMLGNLADSLCNMLPIRGNDYAGLPNHLEALDCRSAVLKEALFDIANKRIRYACIE